MRVKTLMCSSAAFFTMAAVAIAISSAASGAESTWEKIKRTGTLTVGVRPLPPYFALDPASGQWKGAMIEMSKDIAETLGVKLALGETTTGNSVMDLQSEKIDIQFALQATPKRAMAIDFAGPLYELSYIMVNAKNFHGRTWEDYNRPDVKISVTMGSSQELAVKRYAPKAQRIELKDTNEAILAVQSGRATAMAEMTMTGLVAKSRNPDVGEFVQPAPVRGLPSYAGLRYDNDRIFRDFIQKWAEYNRLLGNIETWLKNSMATLGVTDIPEGLTF